MQQSNPSTCSSLFLEATGLTFHRNIAFRSCIIPTNISEMAQVVIGLPPACWIAKLIIYDRIHYLESQLAKKIGQQPKVY